MRVLRSRVSWVSTYWAKGRLSSCVLVSSKIVRRNRSFSIPKGGNGLIQSRIQRRRLTQGHLLRPSRPNNHLLGDGLTRSHRTISSSLSRLLLNQRSTVSRKHGIRHSIPVWDDLGAVCR